ncbi:hypothetical protein ACOTVC_08545 [Campylobacter sp. GB48]|uniref:hypothetical protein n=1 Tax=Campylobacter sp. GB48 TaxID=3400423 RepID=UPI003B9D0884
MTNKEIVEKLRDNAELAWASYGYFHYFLEQQSKSHFLVMQDRQGNEIRDADNKPKIQETYITDILNTNYKNHRVVEFVQLDKEQKEITISKLDGDFSPLQVKQFFSRYDLLKHCSNTGSGFSATLFGEKRKQIDSKTKEKSYTSEYGYINYILAIRGAEMSSFKICL